VKLAERAWNLRRHLLKFLRRGTRGLGACFPLWAQRQTITISGSTSSAASKSIAATTAQFIPDVMPGVSLKSAGPFQAAVSEGKISLNIPIEIQPHNALGKPIVFKGLLLFGQSNSDRCEIMHLPLDIQISQP